MIETDRLDHAPCGFVSFGDDSRITYINSTLLDRLGYTREELVDRHVETILTVPARIFHQTHFFPLVKLHGRAQEVFMLLRTRAGDDVGMLCNAIRHDRDGIATTDCVFMEVHERRKFEEALLQARAAADEANKAKSNFLAVMSHELRTPLNAISGYVQLLDMGVHGPVTQPQRDALARIDRSQRHLLRLINDVLNLARIEAGRVDYVAEPVKLSAVMSDTLPMVEPQMASKKLRLESNVPGDLVAKADREKLQQVVLNLLTNATKFTTSGGAIRVEAKAHGAAELILSVIDTGIGIPQDMVTRIFEPFIQVDASNSRAGEGTGLGLAISRDLARGMGGDLWAESKLGAGSAFHLVLQRG
jgi:PAS domain S-box-containing protein